jgi:excisionase family DNA binding protein
VVITTLEELLSPEEASQRLGVSVYTVRRWIKEGKLRAFRPGKEYRIREADLEEFFRAREVVPKAPRQSPFEPTLNDALADEERLVPTINDFRAAAEFKERCEGVEAFLEKAAAITDPDDTDKWELSTAIRAVRLIGTFVPAIVEKEAARPLFIPASRRFVKVARQLVDLAEKWELPKSETTEAQSSVTDIEQWTKDRAV